MSEAISTTGPTLHPRAGRPGRARLAAVGWGSAAMTRVLARLPEPVKRGLLGGRRVSIDGNTLDTTVQVLLAAQRLSGVGGLVASTDIAAAREQLRRLARAADHAGDPIVVDTRDVTVPGAAGPLRARHYTPHGGVDAAPLLVFFHGGGFVVGDLETHDGLCRLICRDAGIHVLAVDYRLAPEHPAPAAIDDAVAAYRWAVENARELGADPARVAVGGDSAGGNLATVVSRLSGDDGVPAPALQLLIYPVTFTFAGDTRSATLFADGFFLTKADMDWFRDMYLGAATIDASDPRISPLLADDLSGLPPAVVVTCGFDPLRDEGTQYADALAAAGVAVDHLQFGSLVHGFANFFPLGGDSARAVTDVISALKAHLSRT